MPLLTAVVVTYRRPAEMSNTLDALERQTVPPDRWVVVDNGAQPAVADRVSTLPRCEYVAMEQNVGPAGGFAVGVARALERCQDDDLLLLVDDDDPPPDDDTIEHLVAEHRSASRPEQLAGVALAGSRYNRRTGRFDRPTDDELGGLVPVDYLGGGQCPVYSAGALRLVGGYDSSLFFGFDDADLGLRLGAAGLILAVVGPLCRRQRERLGRIGLGRRLSSTTVQPPWRSYYSARNAVLIARRHGSQPAVVIAAMRAGAASPLRDLIHGRPAHAAASVRGAWDGVRGVTGKTVVPASGA